VNPVEESEPHTSEPFCQAITPDVPEWESLAGHRPQEAQYWFMLTGGTEASALLTKEREGVKQKVLYRV
jgi:hypothetical protein